MFLDYDSAFFFELSGDYRHLDDTFIGSDNEIKGQELNNLVFDEEGEVIVSKLNEPTRTWDYFITCGIAG